MDAEDGNSVKMKRSGFSRPISSFLVEASSSAFPFGPFVFFPDARFSTICIVASNFLVICLVDVSLSSAPLVPLFSLFSFLSSVSGLFSSFGKVVLDSCLVDVTIKKKYQ